ncbi:STAS-like domain-containing protein [Sulfobacillus thermosulfidooxidans]|uniref:STAS-like domain-containing protein n=1 Tax=Sulfobacillus thermosulfidooxidans TaxID=28034 RepID=UPI0006B49311|nr:STAS-like domain-containing protein [Sulfobacillus thermosulfidooxidans]
MTIHLNLAAFCGTDTLGQRAQARPLRQHLEHLLQVGQTIHCDFSSVEVMTSAFMDECFGKLWDTQNRDVLRQHMTIHNLTGNNRIIWRFVLAHR